MGAEHSSLIDEDTPPLKLSERSLAAVAEYIKDGRGRQIVVMTGAGLSTAAGIPDFRSPNTGLYANLARLNLPYAEAVFDISYFRQNPDPFYVLAKELYPGNYSPTISHVFIAVLAKKGLLRMLFTQNIDCLERQAGVPGDHIVEAHGSFATQRCIECRKEFPSDLMKEHVFQGVVPRCKDTKCGGLVKPDIVFFGEQLPENFHANRMVPATADLILVMGTSLTVQPFASLPDAGKDDTPRVLFNMERVGSLGTRADDVLALGDCDSNVRKLADLLGWREELESEWRAVVGDKEAERQLKSVQERRAALEDEVEDLASRVEAELFVGDDDDDDEGSIIDVADRRVEEPVGREDPEVRRDTDTGSGSASGVPDATSTTTGRSPETTHTTQTDIEDGSQGIETEDAQTIKTTDGQHTKTTDGQHTKTDDNSVEHEASASGSSVPKPGPAVEDKKESTTNKDEVKGDANPPSHETASKSTL